MNVENQTVTERTSGQSWDIGMKLSVFTREELPIWTTLITAVNFYVLTADIVGKGMLVERKGSRWLTIPIHTADPEQVRDLETLKSRVSELPPEWDVKLERCELDIWAKGVDVSYLHVPEERVDEISRALLERPGPLGWGSFVHELPSYRDIVMEDLLGLPIVPEPVHAELERRREIMAFFE